MGPGRQFVDENLPIGKKEHFHDKNTDESKRFGCPHCEIGRDLGESLGADGLGGLRCRKCLAVMMGVGFPGVPSSPLLSRGM